MEHIFNCHGEWLLILQAVAVLPFVGVWLKNRLSQRGEDS